MRIQITESNGMTYYITSSDPLVISAWFAEHMPVILSDDTRYNHPVTIDVYPTSQTECEQWSNGSTIRTSQGKAAWLNLIEYMGKLADAMEE